MTGITKVPGYTEESDLPDPTVSPQRVVVQDNGPIVSEQERSSLALKGHAPRFFLWTTRCGVPHMCVLLQIVFSFLAYMCVSNNALTVFFWLVDLTAAGVLISWITMSLNHIRLLRALKAQGISPTELPSHNRLTRM
jgi:amino acid permease